MKNTQHREIQRHIKNKRLIALRVMNFLNGCKRKIDEVKRRRLYRYGKNVQTSLNLTVKEEYHVNEMSDDMSCVVSELNLDDNIAIENQVKLVAFKSVGKLVTFSHSLLKVC